jgi:3'-phosphoadenosine 5'-phosphosulfate sulfotransferase (PAPS reductase)/FAD synthetase
MGRTKMSTIMTYSQNDLPSAGDLGFSDKMAHSVSLIHSAYGQLGDRLVFEHNLTPESSVVWDLAKRASPNIRGFCVATRFQPPETVLFMEQLVAQYPEIRIYENFYMEIPEDLPEMDPSLCCKILRDRPKRQALEEMKVSCLMTGFHHVHGAACLDLREFEAVTEELSELTPILAWDDEDVARYVESRQISCISPHEQGTRRVGCSACLRREHHSSDVVDKVALIVQAQAEKNVRKGTRCSA